MIYFLAILSFLAWGGQDLKIDLYKKTARYHTNIGYSDAKKFLFGKLFLNKDSSGYSLVDRYCEKSFNESIGLGPMINPSGVIINCEHSWPKAKFSKAQSYKLQESDLHHLFPVDASSNSLRGNFPFAEVSGEGLYAGCSSSKIGKSKSGNVTSFEPPDFHKGNVARAMFYFSIRYKIAIDPIQESYFRKWNKLDPVDEKEIWQNSEIQVIQGNRNPFIDNSSLIDMISDF